MALVDGRGISKDHVIPSPLVVESLGEIRMVLQSGRVLFVVPFSFGPHDLDTSGVLHSEWETILSGSSRHVKQSEEILLVDECVVRVYEALELRSVGPSKYEIENNAPSLRSTSF